jgi:CheY-like chemotaxis protein
VSVRCPEITDNRGALKLTGCPTLRWLLRRFIKKSFSLWNEHLFCLTRRNGYASGTLVLSMAELPSECPVVLIVEDEFLIRAATADAIREAGFEVLEAANADRAIAILESRSDVQVVFTDIHMPGSMDGAKLARAIKYRWPPVRLIATSGRVALGDLDLPTGTLVFPKPYVPAQVARTLRALTGS